MVDVTLVHSTHPRQGEMCFETNYLRHSESQKLTRYNTYRSLSYGFAPLAIDTCGRIGEQALIFFDRIAKVLVDSNQATEGLFGSSIYHHLRLTFLHQALEATATRFLSTLSRQPRLPAPACEPALVSSNTANGSLHSTVPLPLQSQSEQESIQHVGRELGLNDSACLDDLVSQSSFTLSPPCMTAVTDYASVLSPPGRTVLYTRGTNLSYPSPAPMAILSQGSLPVDASTLPQPSVPPIIPLTSYVGRGRGGTMRCTRPGSSGVAHRSLTFPSVSPGFDWSRLGQDQPRLAHAARPAWSRSFAMGGPRVGTRP